MSMYVLTCIYTHMCFRYIYIYVCIYTCLYLQMYLYIYAQRHICIYNVYICRYIMYYLFIYCFIYFIYLFIHLFYLFIYLFIHLFIYLFIYLFLYIYICMHSILSFLDTCSREFPVQLVRCQFPGTGLPLESTVKLNYFFKILCETSKKMSPLVKMIFFFSFIQFDGFLAVDLYLYGMFSHDFPIKISIYRGPTMFSRDVPHGFPSQRSTVSRLHARPKSPRHPQRRSLKSLGR